MKGIEEIIKAFAFVIREIKNAQLWVVGGGTAEYIRFLKKMANDYGLDKNIIFFENVSQNKKLTLMAKSHILLHASVKEGWGLVVIEAASQGTPAIVYNVTGLRDSVKDEKTGIVLSKNSPQEMAAEIVNIDKNKRKYSYFQKNALVWAKSLTWEKATEQSLDLFEKAIRKR